MNKRSAMLMAAGMVLTMIVAGVAINAGLVGTSASAAAPRARHHRAPKPIVKTIRSTRTVHKKAPQASGSTGIAFSRPAAAPVVMQPVTYPSPTSASYFDDGSEDGGPHGGGGGDD